MPTQLWLSLGTSILLRLWDEFEYEPLHNSEKVGEVFVKKMNELLEWAGNPARTEAQLLGD